MRPAEIHMGKLKKIAVARVTGEAALDVEDDLISQLLEARAYEVLDRANIDKILLEYRLSSSDLIDERTALQIGKMVGAAAFISARVSDYKYDEQVAQGDPYKGKDGKTHVRHTRNGAAKVTVNFKITDLTTGKYIYSRDVSDVAATQTASVDGRPSRIDDDELLKQARRTVVRKFVNKISPHWENVNVRFLTDSDLPELESGVSYAKIREWDRAIELFQSAAEKYAGHKSRHKAYYNLGVAYEYSSQFADAMAALRKAYDLEPDNDYMAEMENCRWREREHNKLKEQIKEE
jgi:tetratricopeptide (TPR) repeat protein